MYHRAFIFTIFCHSLQYSTQHIALFNEVQETEAVEVALYGRY